MLDVVEKARSYRETLLAEIARLEDFLRMGEKLLTRDHPASGTAETADRAAAAAPDLPKPEQESPMVLSASGSADRTSPTDTDGEAGRHKLGLSFRKAFGAAELDRKSIVA